MLVVVGIVVGVVVSVGSVVAIDIVVLLSYLLSLLELSMLIFVFGLFSLRLVVVVAPVGVDGVGVMVIVVRVY